MKHGSNLRSGNRILQSRQDISFFPYQSIADRPQHSLSGIIHGTVHILQLVLTTLNTYIVAFVLRITVEHDCKLFPGDGIPGSEAVLAVTA